MGASSPSARLGPHRLCAAAVRIDRDRARPRVDWSADVATVWYALAVGSEVDVTLVQETLALTPQQRIRQNDRVLRMIEELRDGVAKSGKPARDISEERR